MQKICNRNTDVIQMESVSSSVATSRSRVDIISKLPESLITHFPSFLPTKDAVRTMRCIKFHGSAVLTQPNMALLPKFAMLTHLDLGSVSSKVLLGLLQKSPVLNTLVFKGISKFNQELMNSAVMPDFIEEFKEKLYSFKKGVSFAILEFSFSHDYY
ncbi:hypothetical protein P8452_52303 [Trifolium repens]|nr:hypothetical protein P8452_52303 [Trifolium repens]